jgi:hypothetical protein
MNGVPFWPWLKHLIGLGHDWQQEPVVDNPAYYDQEGAWHPPLMIYKCKWCTATTQDFERPLKKETP